MVRHFGRGAGRIAARSVRRGGIEAWHGLRYGRLSDPGNPRSAVVPAEGQIPAGDLSAVPVFPQLPSRLERVMGPGIRDNPQDHEAFFLNVWAPEAARDLPVLVFLHGGAWVSGGGSARWYRGERLAGEGMVVVTLNYRLGPAGHFEDGQGGDHRPIGDLLAALAWVQANIGAFGGDPGRVTLAGQSAGAWYAWALAGLEAARGLFRRVALLSIPRIRPWTPEHRQALTQEAEALARELEAENPLGQALLQAGAQVLARQPHAPGTIPPMYLPVWPDDCADAATPLYAEALYIRVTGQEMSVFLPPGSTDETVARASGEVFGAFAEEIALAAEARGISAVRRSFAARSGIPGLGAAHCFDLPFQFGNPADWQDAPMLAGWPPDAFRRLGDTVIADLAAFVAGRPQPPRGTFGQGDGPQFPERPQE